MFYNFSHKVTVQKLGIESIKTEYQINKKEKKKGMTLTNSSSDIKERQRKKQR